ncbi:hypothetical protein DFJ74DRAFT_590457, partial [Hyaloraphidium curvatum]
CKDCTASLEAGLTPIVSLSNGLLRGPVPEELQDLTYIEQVMISPVRIRTTIVQLLEPDKKRPSGHHAMTGNFAVLPGDPIGVATVLPHALADLADQISIVLLGGSGISKTPGFVKFFRVRKTKVLMALKYLIAHNPLCRDI